MTPEDILKVEKDIVLTLKNIYDPEIPVNIYDLGLIYEIDYTPDGVANIRMTLTEGKYHQVKRMVAAASNRVEALHRSSFGTYRLPEDLEPGKWVWLSGPEAVLGG